MDAQAARVWPRSHYHLQFHRVTSSREALSWAGRPRSSIPKLNILQGVYVTQAYGVISVLQQGVGYRQTKRICSWWQDESLRCGLVKHNFYS